MLFLGDARRAIRQYEDLEDSYAKLALGTILFVSAQLPSQ